MTQIEQVRALLLNNPNGVCSTTFLKHNIPRFGHHIWTLRNSKWHIDTSTCNLEGHIHKDKQYKYTWYEPTVITKTVNLSEIKKNENLSLSSKDYIKEDNPHNLDNEALQIEKDIDNAEQEDMNKEWEQYSREDKKAKIKEMMREAGIR